MIVFLIVIYNIRVSECLTLQTLRAALEKTGTSSCRILVLDNSEVPVDSQSVARDYDYVPFSANVGLARAYKYGVSYAAEHGAAFMVTLDQDSAVTPEYVATAVAQTYQNRGRDVVLCPRVVCADRQISPYSLSAFGTPQYGSTGKMYAINSFSVYPVSSLARAGIIDEFYWLDALDFVIFENLHRTGTTVVAMPVEVQHSLSLLQGGVGRGRLANIAYYEAAFLLEYCGPIRSLLGIARLFVRFARRTDFTKLSNGFGALLTSTAAGAFRGIHRRVARSTAPREFQA